MMKKDIQKLQKFRLLSQRAIDIHLKEVESILIKQEKEINELKKEVPDIVSVDSFSNAIKNKLPNSIYK